MLKNKMFFKKDELRLLWPFYLDALLSTIFFIFPPFYIIYFKEFLSFFQVGLLIAAISLAKTVFEIPTGAVADIFGRKFSTILGFVLSAISLFAIYYFVNFYILLFLMFVFGICTTLISGAMDAWIVDLVRHERRHNLVEQYYTKGQSFSGVAFFLSGFVGAAFVKKFGLGIIFPVTGMAFMLTALVFLFGKEHFVRKKQHVKEHFDDLIKHTKKSFSYSRRHPVIFNMLLLAIIAAFVGGFGGDMTIYPLLRRFGFREHWFGYFFSATFVLSVFVPFTVKWLAKKAGGYAKYLTWVLLTMLITLSSIGWANNLIILVVLAILFFATWDFFHPARNILFQKCTPRKMRATITSLETMIFSLGSLIAFPIVGLIADSIGVQSTIFYGSFLLIPAIAVMWRIREKK
ncbi:MFS transporter [Candidatus Woesearchaeota archaeon]|nr:MFS transporter [Candidatus Woesearchaeota archaeon]